MSGAPSLLADLLAECNAHNIRLTLADDGGLEIDAPQDALTPDLLARLKAHKADLLAMQRPAPDLAPDNQADAAAVGQAALDRLEGDLLLPPDVVRELRPTDAQWADDSEAGETGHGIEVIDPPDPCPECGTLELWQSLAGNWRCLRCDPPTKARRLLARAAQIREREKRVAGHFPEYPAQEVAQIEPEEKEAPSAEATGGKDSDEHEHDDS